jgi:diamine N-acetyltransferase
MAITIQEITEENWVAAIKLKVKDEQDNFVASNAASIAQSKFHTFLECYGIYNKDEMVGFSAFGKNPEDDTIWIVRHMVDAKHQGKGYGKAGLKAVIKFMQEKFKTDSIFLDVAKDNEIATNLYIKAGFKSTGKKHGESPIYKLDLKDYSEDY